MERALERPDRPSSPEGRATIRPSAFREVYHPDSAYLRKGPDTQLTRSHAADRLFSVPLTRITSVPGCAVSSVGFLWGSGTVSRRCGVSVGSPEPLAGPADRPPVVIPAPPTICCLYSGQFRMAGPRRMNHYGVPRLCRRPRWTSRVGLSRSVGGLTGRPWPGFRVPAQDLLYNPGGLLSGQEVSCVLNHDPLVLAGEAVIVPFAGHGGVRAVAGAVQYQCRHPGRRSCGERRVDRRVGGSPCCSPHRWRQEKIVIWIQSGLSQDRAVWSKSASAYVQPGA